MSIAPLDMFDVSSIATTVAPAIHHLMVGCAWWDAACAARAKAAAAAKAAEDAANRKRQAEMNAKQEQEAEIAAAEAALPPEPEKLKYTFYDSGPISWRAARTKCQAEGGDLASIHSAEDMKIIEDAYMQPLMRDPPADLKFTGGWIGLNDKVTEDRWMWSDGSPMDYEFWLEESDLNGPEPETSGRKYDYAKAAMLESGQWKPSAKADVEGYFCGPGYSTWDVLWNENLVILPLIGFFIGVAGLGGTIAAGTQDAIAFAYLGIPLAVMVAFGGTIINDWRCADQRLAGEKELDWMCGFGLSMLWGYAPRSTTEDLFQGLLGDDDE